MGSQLPSHPASQHLLGDWVAGSWRPDGYQLEKDSWRRHRQATGKFYGLCGDHEGKFQKSTPAQERTQHKQQNPNSDFFSGQWFLLIFFPAYFLSYPEKLPLQQIIRLLTLSLLKTLWKSILGLFSRKEKVLILATTTFLFRKRPISHVDSGRGTLIGWVPQRPSHPGSQS